MRIYSTQVHEYNFSRLYQYLLVCNQCIMVHIESNNMHRSKDRQVHRLRLSAIGRYTQQYYKQRMSRSNIDSISLKNPLKICVVIIIFCWNQSPIQYQELVISLQAINQISKIFIFLYSNQQYNFMQRPQKQNGKSALQQQGPFQMLKTQVYPVINQIILKLIDHIVKSQEVSKHQERLKRKKIIDQLEKKYIERDIEKEQMGSDYQQSDDEQYHKALGMPKEAVQSLIRKRIVKHRQRHLDDDSDNQINGNVFNPMDFIINELKQYQQNKK